MSLVEPALAERVLARALARGGDFAELYAEARRGFAISLDDGRVERPQGGRERGACVRVVEGESTYYGHVDGLAEADLTASGGLGGAGAARRGARAAGPDGGGAGGRSRDRGRAPRRWRRRARRTCCAPATSAPAPRARR